MTTFTMQDLTPEQQETNTQAVVTALDGHLGVGKTAALQEIFTQMGKDLANHELAHQQAQQARLNNAPPQPSITKEQWMEYGMNNPISQSAIDYATQHAPEPQPTPDLPSIINNICTQLQLLATVISQSKAQPEEGTNVPTLQETVSLTLQQADWFRELVRHELIGVGIEDIAKDAVENVVENEVESYFDHRFSPEDHFDFGDAVESAVDDRLDDIVRDRVMDSLEEVVAEKLSEANVSISFN